MKQRLAIVTNIIAPYKKEIYKGIGKHFDTEVFYTGYEDNRQSWSAQEGRRVPGILIKIPVIKNLRAFDYKYVHINPALFWILYKFNPDHIISNEFGVRTIISLIYSIIFSKKIYIWWGGTLHTEKNIGILRHIIRKIIISSRVTIITYGPSSTEYIRSLNALSNQIIEIQNCSIIQEEPQQKDLNKSHDKPHIIYVAQLVNRKGLDILIESALRVGKLRDFSLTIYGDGPLRSKILENIKDANYITLSCSVEYDKMSNVYSAADGIIIPTLSDVWCLVINEGIQHNIPIMGSIFAGATMDLLPKENHFNPLIPTEIDRALERLINKSVARVDKKILWDIDKIVERIVGGMK